MRNGTQKLDECFGKFLAGKASLIICESGYYYIEVFFCNANIRLGSWRFCFGSSIYICLLNIEFLYI